MKKFSDFLRERCWPGYKSVPGKKAYSPGSCMKEETLEEKWTEKYKSSINCSNPKGFSQKAHCAGKKKRLREIAEQHREKGRFKPVKPHNVPSVANVSPRPTSDSANVKLKEDLRKWFSKTAPEGGWKRINSKGEAIGPCAREPGEPKPKCMSNEKRAKLSKKERASAVASKRRHDPNPERQGKPINVSNFGKGKISEDMENLDEKNVPTSPEKWAQAKAQAKAKFDVYPSAYANGWASKKYKEMGGGWKSVSEENEVTEGAVPAQEKIITVKHKESGKTLRISANAADKYRAMGYHYHPVNEAKDEQEYGYEGDMALNQLATLTRCAEMIKDLLKPDTDMPEWVQSKITLATDYIQTAADYMYSEMKEVKEDVSKMPTDKLQKHWDSHKDEQRPSPAFASKLKMVAKELAKRKSMKKEEVEQIEELSDELVGNYLKKVNTNLIKKVGMKPDLYNHLEPKHQKGATRALNRLMKPVKEANNSDGGPPTPAAATLTATGQPKLTKTVGETKLVPMVHEGKMKDIVTNKQEDERLAKQKGSWKVETPWKKVQGSGTVIDKSGAKHTPMSRARDLARQAITRKAVAEQSNIKPNPFTVPEIPIGKAPKKTRQMNIVREAMADAKKKKKEVTEAGSDKFIADPELTTQITKSNP